MIKIQRLETEQLKGKEFVIYGYGKWGRRCETYFLENDIMIDEICDKKFESSQINQNNIKCISPKEMEKKQNKNIIIAIEKFEEVLDWIETITENIYVFWNENKTIYAIKNNYEIMGCRTNAELETLVKQKKEIILVGDEKHREDFKYIFNNIYIKKEYLEEKNIQESYDLLIMCECGKTDAGQKKIDARDFFPLLTGNNKFNVKPYLMMLKTYSDPSVEQPLCGRPFTHAVINSNSEFHFCCGDWSLAVGNVLLKENLDEIWNSTEARIYRLSMINRTYSFCNWNRCVYLKADPAENDELERQTFMERNIPVSLEIGIDKTCNLYCKSCRKQVIVESGARKNNINKAKNVIEQSQWLEKCNTILLGGQGEVFFSDVYRRLMYGNTPRETLDLRTNGVLLNENEFENLCKSYKHLKIIVSIDAATRKTYNELRRSRDPKAWDKLNENLNMLSQKRKGGQLNFFQINMCVQMDNYKEIPSFIEWGERLNVDNIYLTPIRNWGTYSEEEFQNVKIFENEDKTLKAEVKSVINSIMEKEHTVHIEMAFS